ncbi:hypothetical protein EAI89_21115 [Eubacterium sp. am_0171]|uniref:alginate O-acetyltransferase AlgX-related protein n=1 Tax=unclassified Eubacterium (in: firmicutes) TaxID=2624479 RepID=UPI001020D7CD|nr:MULTISPECIES: hypothetical protein [unclassified Eubacterium (in: firmicutes)]MSC86307.1 hypothetical protein [Eubacterium sp. BIOML-A1]MSD08623.1 hypothetical protein [Eubacterium sp. BIOML-A2]RYT11756.1 hypothetical protein EAI89_21115 [Eubacterium sp. am_0171]
MKNKRYLIFIILVWIVLIVPFAGMTFWPTNTTSENTVLAEWPAIKNEDGWNKDYLSEMGEYFEDHFAFRQYFVTANAVIRSRTVKSQATEQVVLGTDGWLYYSGTLDDYQGRNLLSDRELFNIVHNLSLIQEYVEGQGSTFRLTIAPNKNSLYSGNMPYYYRKGGTNNIAMLSSRLLAAGIQYTNLFDAFRSRDEVLYFERDSHWNNRGAVLAYNTLMDSIGREHETYLNVPYEIQKVHTGDIDEMLYPLAAEPEEEYFYDKQQSFSYVNDVTDNMDEWIETVNPDKQGSILMFRDSFGESLLPFVADEMGKGYFSRLVPYNLTQIEDLHPDYVVIEKVERNIKDFIEDVPIMETSQAEAIFAPEAVTDSTIETSKEGSYLLIKGSIDEKYISGDTEITVSVRNNQTMESRTYKTFYTKTEEGDGNGYQLYIKGSSVHAGQLHINTIVTNKGQSFIVAGKDIQWN